MHFGSLPAPHAPGNPSTAARAESCSIHYHADVRVPVDLAPSAGPLRHRTAVCLTCRTALFPGEACDGDLAHEVVMLDRSDGRQQLVEAAWGPLEVRRREAPPPIPSERAMALMLMVAVVLVSIGVALALPGATAGPLHFIAAAVVMTLFGGGVHLLTTRHRDAFPVGGRHLLGDGGAGDVEPTSLALGMRGVATGHSALESPATGSECLAFAVELHLVGYWGDSVMYRDAVTCGFDILLSDGRIARVPAGRVRLIAPMRQVIDVENAALEAYLRGVDPQHEPSSVLDPLRFNVVTEATLLLGDHVELLSRFEPEVNVKAAPTGYREPASTLLAARGLPILRLDPR